jgi:Protein of unknown function (DUF2490)
MISSTQKTISLLLAFLSLHLSAQDLNFKGILPLWNQTGSLGQKLNYNLTIYPTIDLIDEQTAGVTYPKTVLQLYVQPSLIYQLSPQWQVAASYTYQRNNPLNERYTNEHRLWQQATFLHNIDKAQLSHRLRVEERFIQDRPTDTYPLSTRVRYQMAGTIPLEGPTLEPQEYYLSAYSEFFFSLTGPRNTLLSDHWTYLGLGYHTGPWGRVELGYLLQNNIRNAGQDHRYLHLLQMAWFTNFRFW